MEMKINLNKWGNSMAVRIPNSFLKQLGISKDAELEMFLDGDKIVLTRNKFTLNGLLAGIKPQNIHPEIQSGKNIGKEIW